MSDAAVDKLEKARATAPYSSLRDFHLRSGLSREAIENLILAGGMDSFGKPKRQPLWELGILEHQGRRGIPLGLSENHQVPLPGMTQLEEVAAEYKVQGLSVKLHPMQILRSDISRDGVMTGSELAYLFPGTRVRTAGSHFASTCFTSFERI